MGVISEKELWTKKPFKREIGNKGYWAKIKVDRDKKTNKDFFHVWVGKKFEGENRERRLHYGITLDQNILFAFPREVGIALQRDVTSRLRGFLVSNKVEFSKKVVDMLKGVSIDIKIEGNTGEVWVDKFEFKKIKRKGR